MSKRGRHHRRESDLLGLVGWVFADLLLALTIVFIATQPGDPSAALRLTETTTTSAPSTTTTTTTTIPTTTTTSAPPGVDSEFVCFLVRTDETILEGPASPERDAQLADLQAQTQAGLERVGARNRRAGIVLSFGVAGDGAAGTAIAKAYNESVLALVPDVFSAPEGGVTANRAFWDGSPKADRPRGTVMVNVYPITDGQNPPLPRGSGQPC